MTVPRSKVEHLARVLRGVSLVLLVVWVLAAISAAIWVHDEFTGDAGFHRYVTAIADVTSFLIASVVAYVGAAVVEAIGRVRSSVIGFIVDQERERELRRVANDGFARAEQPVERW